MLNYKYCVIHFIAVSLRTALRLIFRHNSSWYTITSLHTDLTTAMANVVKEWQAIGYSESWFIYMYVFTIIPFISYSFTLILLHASVLSVSVYRFEFYTGIFFFKIDFH